MSRRLLISVLVSLAAGAAQARVLDCELNGQAVNRNNGNELAGKSGMLRCKDRDDGKIVLEENYANGRPIGYQKTTGMDGRVTVRNVNANGNSDGPYKSLRPNGSVESEETYANGDRVGEARFFYPNGKLRRLGFYEAGRALNEIEYHDNGQLAALRCGDKAALTEVRDLCGFSGRASEVQLFRSNGDVARTVSYRDGKLVARTSNSAQGTPSETESVEGSDRVVRALHPNGKVKLETRYREQRRHGVEKEFADSGQLTRETTWDLGERTTESRWYLNGQRESVATREKRGDATIAKTEEFWDNGKLRTRASFTETIESVSFGRARTRNYPRGRADGPYLTFYEDGTPDDEWNFRLGKREGLQRSYHPNGKLAVESTYEDDKLTRKKEWDRLGALTLDEAYFPDGSRRSQAAR